jgi:hypothetical protein
MLLLQIAKVRIDVACRTPQPSRLLRGQPAGDGLKVASGPTASVTFATRSAGGGGSGGVLDLEKEVEEAVQFVEGGVVDEPFAVGLVEQKGVPSRVRLTRPTIWLPLRRKG